MFTKPDWHSQKWASAVKEVLHFGQLDVGFRCLVGFDERFFRFVFGFLSIFYSDFLHLGLNLWTRAWFGCNGNDSLGIWNIGIGEGDGGLGMGIGEWGMGIGEWGLGLERGSDGDLD